MQDDMRHKVTTGFLALIFGMFGVHRFYLGQRFLGALYFIAAVAGIFLTALSGMPFIMLPALLGFVDGVLFFAMPREVFDERYNSGSRSYRYAQPRLARRSAPARRPLHRQASEFDYFKRNGIAHFRAHRFEEAAEAFEQAAALAPEHPAIHYNLAATYSMLEEADIALEALDQAVAMGFDQYDKIHRHDALAFLRARPEFKAFVSNGYRLPEPSSPAAEVESETLELGSLPSPADPLLEQIEELGKLRDRGILTDAEFAQQKEKLLSS